MSKLGGFTAFGAEAALWIAGAAIIAGAAGAHWSVQVPSDLSDLMGSTPTPAASASPSPSVKLATLAPGATPTTSPLVAKFQAFVARPDYQIVAKFVVATTLTVSGTPSRYDEDGRMQYEAGDHYRNERETSDGVVTTIEEYSIASTRYQSVNGGDWTKSARDATDSANDRLTFAPAVLFIDKGVETKNGRQLHRLEPADAAGYSAAQVHSTSGATDGQLSYAVWVDDNGVPAAFHMEGWLQEPIKGVSTKVSAVIDFRVIFTTGVYIHAPI